jgi:preprotein translocase subunit YajC
LFVNHSLALSFLLANRLYHFLFAAVLFFFGQKSFQLWIGGSMFKQLLRFLVVASLCLLPARADEDVVTAVHGTVTKVDEATKTIVVKTADGTEHTFHFVAKTTVRGAEASATGAKDSFHGLKEGSEVVAHYTAKGGEETAVAVEKVGKGGLHAVDGTVTHVSEDGKTVVVKAADGTEHTFQVIGHDTASSAKEIGKGADKTAKVTVYYTESAGKKVAHFFQKL